MLGILPLSSNGVWSEQDNSSQCKEKHYLLLRKAVQSSLKREDEKDLLGIRSLTNRPDRGVWSPLLLQGPRAEPCRAEPSRVRADGALRLGCSCMQRPRGGTFSPRLRRALPGGWASAAPPALRSQGSAGPARAPPTGARSSAKAGAEQPGASLWKWGMALGWREPLGRGANFQTVLAKYSRRCPLPFGVALAPRCRSVPGAWVKNGNSFTRHPSCKPKPGMEQKASGSLPCVIDEGGHSSTARGRRDGDQGSASRGRPH